MECSSNQDEKEYNSVDVNDYVCPSHNKTDLLSVWELCAENVWSITASRVIMVIFHYGC